MTDMESLDIRRPAPTRCSFDRLLASPEFWKGLCAAREERNPDDRRLIASYERAEAALRAEPDRDIRTVPEIVEWLGRRCGPPLRPQA